MSSTSMRMSYSSRTSSMRSSTNSIGSSASENLPPRVLQRVARELRSLHKQPPEGVRLVLDPESGCPAGTLTEIIAEVEGPTGTPYESRYFQLKLVLQQDFPSKPPLGYFLTKIYHPNVDMSNGAICVNTLKRDWNDGTSLSHVLSVIRCLLIVPFPESSLNDEAGKFFMESYDEYARRARLMASVHGKPNPCCSYRCEKGVDKSKSDFKPSPKRNGSSSDIDEGSENRMDGGNKQIGRKDVSHKRESRKAAAEKKSKKKSLKRL